MRARSQLLQNLIRTQESMKETQEESQSAFERKLSTLQKQVTNSRRLPVKRISAK